MSIQTPKTDSIKIISNYFSYLHSIGFILGELIDVIEYNKDIYNLVIKEYNDNKNHTDTVTYRFTVYWDKGIVETISKYGRCIESLYTYI